jgi:hypothetical protein
MATVFDETLAETVQVAPLTVIGPHVAARHDARRRHHDGRRHRRRSPVAACRPQLKRSLSP